ncbi:MAG TPA: sensor histidine kinase, partial [Saprospiraceae bacterium]|nr:sensor histidine kinase [Saprospiraceae bacterium]
MKTLSMRLVGRYNRHGEVQTRSKHALRAKIVASFSFLLIASTLFAQDKHVIDSLYGAFHAEKDPVKKIDLLYDIANEKDEAGNPDEGLRYADSLEAMSKAARYDRGLARAYDIRGISLRHKGELAAALPVFHEQLAIFSKLNDLEGQGRALGNIGSTWQEMTVNDSAIVYQLRSLDLKERLGNMGDVASALSNIANIYSDEHAYDKAIEMLQRALRIRRELGEEKRSMFTLNNLAVAYGTKGDFEKSIAYADTGITVALKYDNKFVAGVICGGMGHVLNEQKRYEESVKWCERSLAYMTEANREASMVYPLCNMAAAYIGLGQYAKGLEVNQRGWAIMQKLNLPEPIDPYHENFANAYAGLGDYQNAYKWHKIYFARIDSITERDNLSKVANIEAKYGLEKKERQLSEQKAENFRQRTVLYALAAALFAFLILGWLFYNRFRLRQKAKLDAAVIREQKLGLNAVIEAQEAERKRIAKDLHDGIAQELVALKLGFDALGRRIGKIAPDESARFADLNTQLDTSCTEVRNIAHVMMPPTLEQHGLAPSLELLLRNTAQPAGLQVRFDTRDLPPKLDEKTQIGLYRITQELLNNIIKHARASKVLIQLFRADNQLVMRVEDDGEGFDFEVARQKGTMGVLNILSRVNTLGGEFFSEKALPHGTVSVVRVPVDG